MVETLSHYLGACPILIAPLLLVIFTISTVCCLPAAWLILACGALLGLGQGTLVANLSCVVGAALTRWLARGRWGQHVDGWLSRNRQLRQIRGVLHDGGWQLTFLVRLSPLLPLGISHWVFAFVDLPLMQYLVVTSLATLPTQLMWVQFGVSGRKGLMMWQNPGSATTAEWTLLLIGVGATIAFIITFGILTRRRLRSKLAGEASCSSAIP
ncbi:MAG: VTT domain-containing protein [Myxococcales bacterium]|nr:VTT domain-containing protein [Myxococcales bacterium]